MINAKGALSLLLALAAGLWLAPSARADSQVRIVRLSLVSGPVQIDRGDGFEKAVMNMPITQGMKLWTQGDSRAEVEFEEGATMRLTPGSKVDFEQLALLSSGAKASTVKVSQGEVYFNVPHKGENEFRVAFDGQQVSLTRSVHFRLELTADQARIAVFKGELMLSGPKEIKLKKNETAALDRSGAEQGAYQLAKGITPGPYDEWDAYRLEFDSQYASAGSKGVPYYYGRSDLNYWGSWGYIPGYGNLWRPFGFGYGWDPFSAGYWAWYPGWGYTWVSGYPWGWIPYRYGSWMWVNNYGWCWRPGATLITGIPAVVNPPAGYVGPQPPPATPVATGGTTAPAPHPPTVAVGPGPRRRVDDDGNLLLPLERGADRVRSAAGATATTAPATTSGTAPAAPAGTATTTTAAPTAAAPSRPVRTFVPRSGPGMGRPPAAMDDSGVVRRGFGDRGSFRGLGAPPSPRMSGAQGQGPRMSAPRPSGASGARQSAPSSSRPSAPSSSHPTSPRPPSNPK